MQYTTLKQYEIANDIMTTICMVGHISFIELCYRKKTAKLNILRGLYCYCTRERGVAPRIGARLMGRTRCNVINQSCKYWHYLQVKDKYITNLYNTITEYERK